MNHKVFIPVTDEILYDYPELITAPLRPYQIDNPCYHWMATIECDIEHDSASNVVSIDIAEKQNNKSDVAKDRQYFDHTMPLDGLSVGQPHHPHQNQMASRLA